MRIATGHATAVGFALLRCLAVAHGGVGDDCDVPCQGLTFLGGPHKGQPVCGNEGCGLSAPYVGLENFGCSSNKHAWGGKCCTQNSCTGQDPTRHPHGQGQTGAKCTDGREGTCMGGQALQRRSDAVTAECCDQPSEDCSGGMPKTCNAGCAHIMLPFWDDCARQLGTSADLFTEVVVKCRAAAKKAAKDAATTAPYVLDTVYSGASFADEWEFFTDLDPTGGCVRYVDKAEALAASMAGLNTSHNRSFDIRVDSTRIHHSCHGDGRPSVRLGSKKSWHLGGLFSIDLEHMPSGCGTWPAFWLVAAPCGSQAEVRTNHCTRCSTRTMPSYVLDHVHVWQDKMMMNV